MQKEAEEIYKVEHNFGKQTRLVISLLKTEQMFCDNLEP